VLRSTPLICGNVEPLLSAKATLLVCLLGPSPRGAGHGRVVPANLI
jgi:hypothetical protein